MAKPKPIGMTRALNGADQSQAYFKTTYALNKVMGGQTGLQIGQEIYCLPLVKEGVYEMACHVIKARGTEPNTTGFKSKFKNYILCKGYNEDEGTFDESAPCCRIAQDAWAAANAHGGEAVINRHTFRYFIPILVLGNDSGQKTALNIPMTQLTMTGREYSYLELADKTYREIIENFKASLVNSGRIEYNLEGDDLNAAIMSELQKHILKISIQKPTLPKGKHTKVFSFIPFDNKSIGAATGSYKNITMGLTASKKLIAEAQEFTEKFSVELDNFFPNYTEEELRDYVFEGEDSAGAEQTIVQSGVPPKKQEAVVAKEDQIVITEDDDLLTDDLAMEDGEDLDLDLEPEATPAAGVTTSAVDVSDEDLSFDMGDEDFFGE